MQVHLSRVCITVACVSLDRVTLLSINNWKRKRGERSHPELMLSTERHLCTCTVIFPSAWQKPTAEQLLDLLARMQEKVQTKCSGIFPAFQRCFSYAFCRVWFVHYIPKRIFNVLKTRHCLDHKNANTHYLQTLHRSKPPHSFDLSGRLSICWLRKRPRGSVNTVCLTRLHPWSTYTVFSSGKLNLIFIISVLCWGDNRRVGAALTLQTELNYTFHCIVCCWQ